MSELKPYMVYFSVGEKKMKMTVVATNAAEAEQIVRDKLTVVKTEPIPLDTPVEDSAFEQAMGLLDEVMDALGGKRMARKVTTWADRLEALKNNLKR